MIRCEDLYEWLSSGGVELFTGVPDSLLKDFCACLADRAGDRHVAAANEGGAVALACGHHLATGRTALVYMQNSGQGNAVNPLASLADPDVYGIPLVMVIGWRGRPGQKDEPQHVKQGKITLTLMETLGVPCRVMDPDPQAAEKQVAETLALASAESAPVGLVVCKGTFQEYAPAGPAEVERNEMTRERAVIAVAEGLRDGDAIVSTTGKTSRELYEHRTRTGGDYRRDFLTVGSMGHASQIAMGIALARPDRQIFCLDGDGAMIMHLGSVAVIGARGVSNLKHVVFNNGAHDSVGGMATVGRCVSFTAIAQACGYRHARRLDRPEQIPDAMANLRAAEGPAMLEILVCKGARPDLGRPKTSPQQNKAAFMEFLRP